MPPPRFRSGVTAASDGPDHEAIGNQLHFAGPAAPLQRGTLFRASSKVIVQAAACLRCRNALPTKPKPAISSPQIASSGTTRPVVGGSMAGGAHFGRPLSYPFIPLTHVRRRAIKMA